MKKVCKNCGKLKVMLSWETLCYQCTKESELKQTQKAIREAKPDEKPDTWSNDYVICPYCGEALDTDLSYDDFPEIYEEGTHEIVCPECERTFLLETNVSYSWETEQLPPADSLKRVTP